MVTPGPLKFVPGEHAGLIELSPVAVSLKPRLAASLQLGVAEAEGRPKHVVIAIPAQQPRHFQVEGFRLEAGAALGAFAAAAVRRRAELRVDVAGLQPPVADQHAPALALDAQGYPRRNREIAIVRGGHFSRRQGRLSRGVLADPHSPGRRCRSSDAVSGPDHTASMSTIQLRLMHISPLHALLARKPAASVARQSALLRRRAAAAVGRLRRRLQLVTPRHVLTQQQA